MPAFCLFDNLEITDTSKLEEYRLKVAPVVEQYGGRYVVIGGPFEVLEGTWAPIYPVVIEFPSLDQARRWYDSEEYRDLKALRLSAGRYNAVFMEGIGAAG